jgi:hypothetical protein
MKTTIKITNESLYNSNVKDVDTSMLKCNDSYNRFIATGNISIQTNEGWKEFDGEHGQNDYQEEYGFILIPEN